MKAARIRDECQEEREESLALLPPRAHTRENHSTNASCTCERRVRP